MSVQNKATQKTHFEDGDKPSGSDFANLIDSQVGIADSISIVNQVIADTTALKAVDISSVPDMAYAYVNSEGEYYYDSSSGAAENLPAIVQPNTGSGRWFLKDGLGAGVNANSLLKNIVASTTSLSTDDTLGGSSPGNTLYSSQEAVKVYIDNTHDYLFGDGSDGDLTISSSTTVTLSKDTYYNNVTISGAAKIVTKGFMLFVKGTLDLSNAAAGAIQANAVTGTNASGSTAGVIGTLGSAGTIGIGTSASNGASGSTGVGAVSGIATAASPGNGGSGSTCGGAGTGTSGAGGAAGGGALASNQLVIANAVTPLLRGATLISGGAGGRGGPSGAGDGTNSGGGGGGGGNGGAIVAIYANTIYRGAATAASVIQARGANGGNGGTPATGNTGGGGGAGAGGGGWIYLVCKKLTGTVVTNALDATGGNGGNGGNGKGTGTGGNGAKGGYGGLITVIDIMNNTATVTNNSAIAGSNGTNASGTTGGTGGSATSTLQNL